MQRSPLEFSRFWADLMAAVDQAPSTDVRLIILTRLWDELNPFQGDARYPPYFHEYEGRLDTLITAHNLLDFSIEDHKHLRSAAMALSLHRHIPILVTGEARLHAYVGDADIAVELLCGVTGEKVEVGPLTEDLSTVSEMRRLEAVIPRLETSAPQVAKMLSEILAGWQAEVSALSHDRARCLLVQIGPHIHGPWGHLSQLSGTVDLMRKKNSRRNGAIADQVTFVHQIKESNDPAIGGVYDSLAGVRKLLGDLGLARFARERAWAVRLQFEGTNPMVHGDSLGLAAGLVTLAGLMKEEFLRHERKLSGEVGFTGGVDADGRLTAVNESTLRAKIERAFFSHLKYLVLPKENEEATIAIVGDLTMRHPRRKLHIVAAETLADVVDNRNIVRPEKLCPTAYIVKGALKYSRATKVQVPLLATLVLLLGFILADQFLPECVKPWGDCNPAFVLVEGSSLSTLNSDSTLIWRKDFDCSLVDHRFATAVADLNSDGTREVLIFVQNEQLCKYTHHLLAYSNDGRLLWDVDCRIKGEYPGDFGDTTWYAGGNVHIFWANNELVIVTGLVQSNPSRMLFKLFDRSGNLKSWYINAGAAGPQMVIDLNDNGGQGIVFAGTNRRVLGAVVFALRTDSIYGVSPPYFDAEYDISWVRPGNQVHYAVCPPTKLCFLQSSRNPYPLCLGIQTTGRGNSTSSFSLVTGEGSVENEVYYFFDSKCRVVRVDFGDTFELAWSQMAGKQFSQTDWNTLADTIARAVMYWTDSGFVTEGALLDAGQ
jgi:hypothetical protein